MAKATKTKEPTTVIEPIVEETKPEVIETPVAEIPVEETKTETVVEEIPKIQEKIPDEAFAIKAVRTEPIEVANGNVKVIGEKSAWNEMSMEDKILAFLQDKKGEVKMNDYLKSLFGVSVGNEPPKWANQGASKLMRTTLDKLVKENGITIHNNLHTQLGTFYYPDMTTGKTQYHTLNTVPIIVVM